MYCRTSDLLLINEKVVLVHFSWPPGSPTPVCICHRPAKHVDVQHGRPGPHLSAAHPARAHRTCPQLGRPGWWRGRSMSTCTQGSTWAAQARPDQSASPRWRMFPVSFRASTATQPTCVGTWTCGCCWPISGSSRAWWARRGATTRSLPRRPCPTPRRSCWLTSLCRTRASLPWWPSACRSTLGPATPAARDWPPCCCTPSWNLCWRWMRWSTVGWVKQSLCRLTMTWWWVALSTGSMGHTRPCSISPASWQTGALWLGFVIKNSWKVSEWVGSSGKGGSGLLQLQIWISEHLSSKVPSYSFFICKNKGVRLWN